MHIVNAFAGLHPAVLQAAHAAVKANPANGAVHSAEENEFIDCVEDLMRLAVKDLDVGVIIEVAEDTESYTSKLTPADRDRVRGELTDYLDQLTTDAMTGAGQTNGASDASESVFQ